MASYSRISFTRGLSRIALISALILTGSLQAEAQELCPTGYSTRTIDLGDYPDRSELLKLDQPHPLLGAIGDINANGAGDFMTVTRQAPSANATSGYILNLYDGASKDGQIRQYNFRYQFPITWYLEYRPDSFSMCDEENGEDCSAPKYATPLYGYNVRGQTYWSGYNNLVSQLRVTAANGLDADLNDDGVPEYAVGTRCVMTPNPYVSRWTTRNGGCCFEPGALKVFDGKTGAEIYQYAPERGHRPYFWWYRYGWWIGGGRGGGYWNYTFNGGLMCDGVWGNSKGFTAAAADTDGDGKAEILIGDPEGQKIVVAKGAMNGAKWVTASTRTLDPMNSQYNQTVTANGRTINVNLFEQFPTRFLGGGVTVLRDTGPSHEAPRIIASDPQYGFTSSVNPDPNKSGSGLVLSFLTPDQATAKGFPTFIERMLTSGYGDSRTGYEVKNIGDLDGDKYDDLMVSSPGDIVNLLNEGGSVALYSGKTMKTLRFADTPSGVTRQILNGDTAGENFGYSVSGGSDLNADAMNDFVIAVPGDSEGSGSVKVVSGKDGIMKYELFGDEASKDRFGQQVSSIGQNRLVVADIKGRFKIFELGADVKPANFVPDRCEVPPVEPTPVVPASVSLARQLYALANRGATFTRGINSLTKDELLPAEFFDPSRNPTIQNLSKKKLLAKERTEAMRLLKNNIASISAIIKANQRGENSLPKNVHPKLTRGLSDQLEAMKEVFEGLHKPYDRKGLRAKVKEMLKLYSRLKQYTQKFQEAPAA